SAFLVVVDPARSRAPCGADRARRRTTWRRELERTSPRLPCGPGESARDGVAHALSRCALVVTESSGLVERDRSGYRNTPFEGAILRTAHGTRRSGRSRCRRRGRVCRSYFIPATEARNARVLQGSLVLLSAPALPRHTAATAYPAHLYEYVGTVSRRVHAGVALQEHCHRPTATHHIGRTQWYHQLLAARVDPTRPVEHLVGAEAEHLRELIGRGIDLA